LHVCNGASSSTFIEKSLIIEEKHPEGLLRIAVLLNKLIETQYFSFSTAAVDPKDQSVVLQVIETV